MAGRGKRGGASKKPPPNSSSNEEGNFVVFSNAKDEPKSKNSVSKASSRGEASKSQPDGENVPKKPDTRTLIGGASWTGKLPVNLLSEHCQKQKWEKPEYTMVNYRFE